MAVHAEDIDDLYNLVVEDYFTFKDTFADLAALVPDAFVAARVLNKAKKKGGSHKFTWNLKVRNVGTYRSNVGLFDVNTPDRADMFIKGEDTYTGMNIGTYYDINEDEFASPSMAVKVEYMKELISAAIQRLMLGFSGDLWSYPTTSAEKGIHGFPYWVAKSATTTVETFGFNGQAIYSDDTVGGVNQATYTSWKNGTAVVGTLASEDGLDQWSRAMNRCNFRTQSDKIGSPEDRGVDGKYAFYTTEDNFEALERYTRNQNDNVGKDLGAYRGSVVFRNTPVLYLNEFTYEELEEGVANPAYGKHDDNPLYGINWDTFTFFTKLGTGFKKTGPDPRPGQRFVREVNWDQFAQLACRDRRKNFVITQAA